MSKQIIILLQIILFANVLLAQSCSQKKCTSCSSGSSGRRGSSANSCGNSCEPSVVPCYEINDLIVLIDSSGSIGSGNYETVKSFVEKLAAGFTVQSGSRISIVIFSNSVNALVALTNTLHSTEISYKILNAPYLAGQTRTDLGIDASIAQFNSSPRSVPRNLVILTDGESNDPSLTVAAANKVISLGVRTFSVGVGNSINNQELLDIAGGNQDRVYTMSTFGELIKVLTPLSLAICAN